MTRKLTLSEQIIVMRCRLMVAKPRSNLRVKLEMQLRDLMLRELRKEIKQERKAA
jgi:hypothetical protein